MVSKTLLKVSAVVVAATTVAMAAMAFVSLPSAYATGRCDSTDVPPFKDFPGASGHTGNPHTCEQPTGDPHLDPDNPSTGNPHNQ